MTRRYNEGTKVEWYWGQGEATGIVSEIFTRDVTRTIKGSEIKREASEDCPAYLIEQDDGDSVLNSPSEVHKAF